MKHHQKLHTLVAALYIGFFALAGCSGQSASELATGRWSMPDGSGMMLIDLPHGKLEIWQVFSGKAVPVFQAKHLKIDTEESNPQQVTVSYDAKKQRRTMTLRILWRRRGKSFNLAIINQLTGKVTRLGFLSKSSESPQITRSPSNG